MSLILIFIIVINFNLWSQQYNNDPGLKPDYFPLVNGIIRDDYLINSDTSGWADQILGVFGKSVAIDNAGNFVIVWDDNRLGYTSVYGRLFDSSGQPKDSSFLVATPAPGGQAMIDMDAAGNFIVVWGGNYGQRYDLNGQPIGGNFQFHDDYLQGKKGYGLFSMTDSGFFVVVWIESKQFGYNALYARRFHSNCIPIGDEFQVSDSIPGVGYLIGGGFSVAVRYDSSFVIAWGDRRNGDLDIYAQLYNANGNPVGGNFRINDDTGNLTQERPSVSMSKSGRFIVVWDDERIANNYGDIFGQLFTENGQPMGSNFQINEAGLNTQYRAEVSMDETGNFIVVWQDFRIPLQISIFAQRFDANGQILGNNFIVNDTGQLFDERFYPSVKMNYSGNCVVCWMDPRNSPPLPSSFANNDIFFQRYDSLGQPVGTNLQVNEDDAGTSSQLAPEISMDDAGNFVAVWWDERNDNGDIYAQRFDSSGREIGGNIRVNDDNALANQYQSSVSMNPSGRIAFTWHDTRNTPWGDIYSQIFDENGLPIGNNLKVNNPSGDFYKYNPSVGMDSNGRVVIVWSDKRSGDFDVYAQRIESNGQLIGSNIRVNDDLGNTAQGISGIGMSPTGNYVITWGDARNSTMGDIYAQLFNNNGQPIGSNFQITDEYGPNDFYQIYSQKLSINSSGDFVVIWIHRIFRVNFEQWEILGRRYDQNGTPLGNFFVINNDFGASIKRSAEVSLNDLGNFVVLWQDEHSVYESYIVGQRFDGNGDPIGSHYFIIPGSQYYNIYFDPAGVAANSDRMAFVWEDNRRKKGWDIYGKVVTWDWEGVTSIPELTDDNIPLSYDLKQNYPNPFNPSTSIHYDLPKATHVVLSIYNILGQKVRTLVNQWQAGGKKQVVWNGRDEIGRVVSSGIYIYQIEAGEYVQSLKMLLVR